MVNFATTGIKGLRPRIHHLRSHCRVPMKDKLAGEIINELNPKALRGSEGRDIARITEQALEMNRIALTQIKNPIKAIFPKASEKDLKMLLDSTPEGSALKAVYTHPKTGKVYNLLLTGKTENGEKIIRILDGEGVFVKTVNVKPKTIAILDNFNNGEAFNDNSLYQILYHGDKVATLAKRTNPFAEYIIIHCEKDQGFTHFGDGFTKLQHMIDNGTKVDYVSCSSGIEQDINDLIRQLGMPLRKASETESYSADCISEFMKKNPFIRLFKAAGNAGKNRVVEQLLNRRVEGVGSIAADGCIAKHSSSRFFFCTPHYEREVFPIRATNEGLSFASLYGNTTDILLREDAPAIIKKFHGKKLKLANEQELEMIRSLKNKIKHIYGKELEEAEKELAQLKEKLAREGKMIQYSNGNYGLPDYDLPGHDLAHRIEFRVDSENNLMAAESTQKAADSPLNDKKYLTGTSFPTPIRAAHVALEAMLGPHFA